MKHLPLTLSLISALFLLSCQFSTGVKKDLNTGLTASYNGLSIDDVYLADADGNKLNNNTIALGSKFQVVATGVDFFDEKDGKVYPGCTITLTDSAKNELLKLPDAFASLSNGTSAAEAKILQASLNTGDPMVVGSTYHLNVRFFDKHKKESEILADVNVVMK